jgi:hypothetical protein
MAAEQSTSIPARKQPHGKGWSLGAELVPRRTCEACGGSFYAPPCLVARGGGRFCSNQCRADWNKANHNPVRVKFACSLCGKEFTDHPCHGGKRRHCSRECAAQARRPGGVSAWACKGCGQFFFHERAGYCGDACRKKARSGPNNHNWKGGLRMAICTGCGKEFQVRRGCTGLVCSLRCWGKVRTSHTPGSIHPKGKGGKREDLGGLYVRSRWEANWARYLNWLVAQGQISRWEYEPDVFEFVGIRRGTRFYTPDFKVYNLDGTIEYHEVKGWLTPGSKTKLKRMAKYHPNVKVVLIEVTLYRSICKKMAPLIPCWEKSAKKGY